MCWLLESYPSCEIVVPWKNEVPSTIEWIEKKLKIIQAVIRTHVGMKKACILVCLQKKFQKVIIQKDNILQELTQSVQMVSKEHLNLEAR